MKDPAFPFYAQDFIVGTMHLTFQETGAYIKLLAYQWVNLGIPKNRLGFILGSDWESIWLSISDKFIEKEGAFYNQRLEFEREKRAEFKQKQAENGKKGGRPKKTETPVTTATKPKSAINKNPTKTQKKPLENESEDEKENVFIIEKGKEGTGEKPNAALPFPTAEFASQWDNWKNYKATQHSFSYISTESEQAALLQLNTLSNYNETTAIAILHQSMSQGWKGLFELKQDSNAGKPASKGKVRYSSDFQRKIAERLQSG